MKTIAKMETYFNFNPWPSAGPPSYKMPAPSRGPAEWYLLLPAAADAVGGAALTAMAEHPERHRPGDAHFLAERTRDELTRRREAGDPGTRAAFEWLESARGNNSMLLVETVRQLLERGSLLDTLRRDRAALDAAIGHLERQTPAGP